MPPTEWLFVGSAERNGILLAQQDGSIVTTYAALPTIIANPHLQASDDAVYFVNDQVMPPVGTPVELVIEALPQPAADPQDGSANGGSREEKDR